MHESLSTLTNDHVARLILRQLWQHQDAGGISMGRGFRNVLLESAIHMMPMPEMRDADVFREHALFEEAARRKVVAPRGVMTVPSLKRISRRTLAILVLHEMRAWYRTDARKDPLHSLTYESRMLDESLYLLRLPRGFKKPSSWSSEDLIAEARERYRAHVHRGLDGLTVLTKGGIVAHSI